MPKYFFGILLLFSFGISCTDNTPALFNMQMEVDFTIPAGLNTLDTHVFILRNVPTRVQSYIGNANRDNITRVLANRARLTGLFTAIDYAIIDQITIDVINQEDPEDLREVFWMSPVPLNQEGDLNLFSSLSEVKEMMLQETADFEVAIRFRTFTSRPLESRLFMDFSVFDNE